MRPKLYTIQAECYTYWFLYQTWLVVVCYVHKSQFRWWKSNKGIFFWKLKKLIRPSNNSYHHKNRFHNAFPNYDLHTLCKEYPIIDPLEKSRKKLDLGNTIGSTVYQLQFKTKISKQLVSIWNYIIHLFKICCIVLGD